MKDETWKGKQKQMYKPTIKNSIPNTEMKKHGCRLTRKMIK